MDDVEELRRALLSAYGEVIGALAQGSRGSESGIGLCRRKWNLEAMLRQLDGPGKPPAALEIIPGREHTGLEQVAA